MEARRLRLVQIPPNFLGDKGLGKNGKLPFAGFVLQIGIFRKNLKLSLKASIRQTGISLIKGKNMRIPRETERLKGGTEPRTYEGWSS